MRNYFNPHNIEPFIPTKNAGDSTENGTNFAGDINVLSTMTTAEAIRILERIETDIYGRIAISKAIDALNSPWVKTSDRLPTEEDADEDGKVPIWAVGPLTGRWVKTSVHYKAVPANVELIKYFLPIPPLPEVER